MKSTIWQAGILTGLALIFAIGSVFLHPKRPAWYEIRVATPWDLPVEKVREVVGDRVDEILWVDARKEAAYQKEHRKGAILITKEDLGGSLVKHQDVLQAARDKPVIVYCDGRNCDRSREIAETLRQIAGLEPVYILKGNWREFR
ncbi:MAG: rhodanese-like domain-containing protein [Verrucomicrobiales bacterium]|nr:rhodanese-like domain-containing protein [Verrucomicrobiales bacterium]